MGALEKALQFLRPLVNKKAWDFCVVWKCGDDPSRFIEWIGCCCSGACSSDKTGNLKEKTGELQQIFHPSSCKDTFIKHLPNSKACEALADLPPSMPLYSGIHGEAVMSVEPKWHTSSSESNPNQSEESSGTHVLIPVIGGLIELFASKNIPKDKKLLESITSQYNTLLVKEDETALRLFSSSVNEDKPAESLYLGGGYSLCSDYNPKLPIMASYPRFARTSTDSNPSITSAAAHDSLTEKQESAIAASVDYVVEKEMQRM